MDRDPGGKKSLFAFSGGRTQELEFVVGDPGRLVRLAI